MTDKRYEIRNNGHDTELRLEPCDDGFMLTLQSIFDGLPDCTVVFYMSDEQLRGLGEWITNAAPQAPREPE